MLPPLWWSRPFPTGRPDGQMFGMSCVAFATADKAVIGGQVEEAVFPKVGSARCCLGAVARHGRVSGAMNHVFDDGISVHFTSGVLLMTRRTPL